MMASVRLAAHVAASVARLPVAGCRRHFSAAPVSALREAAGDFRAAALAACMADDPSLGVGATGSAAFLGSGESASTGGFSAVRGQAAMVSAWSSHPLQPAERLMLAEALAARPAALGLGPSRQGPALCEAFGTLLQSPGGLLGVRGDGTGRCAVVRACSEGSLPAACSEVVALLLTGHAVSLAAPRGAALEAAEAIMEGFPLEILQAVEDVPGAELPAEVHAVRIVGGQESPSQLWSDQHPPPDFGGRTVGGVAHGFAASAPSLGLARTNVTELAKLPRSRYDLGQEGSDLAALFSIDVSKEAPGAPGLPPPRWARSAYDRGLEEVNDLLDLLWSFEEPLVVDAGAHTGVVRVSMTPAPKHLIITKDSTEIPEEIVKAAVLSAASPFCEPVTLHAVGLGAMFFSKDPYRGFCRSVQSGRSGLQWNIQEHESWAAFILWLKSLSESSGNDVQPPVVFGKLRGMDSDLHRLAARTGGVAWQSLFPPEPLEQLRRWCRPVAVRAATEDEAVAQLLKMRGPARPAPEVDISVPVIVTEDD
mmetsp:Transcript_143112/g.457451  ORF Transcript_143112/g.457451 Transcript_143112/m.457451 type:complete len:537 (-) Transcript_143112:64-1674(-)